MWPFARRIRAPLLGFVPHQRVFLVTVMNLVEGSLWFRTGEPGCVQARSIPGSGLAFVVHVIRSWVLATPALGYMGYMSEVRKAAGAPRRSKKATRPPRSRQATFVRRSHPGTCESAAPRGRPGVRPRSRTS